MQLTYSSQESNQEQVKKLKEASEKGSSDLVQ